MIFKILKGNEELVNITTEEISLTKEQEELVTSFDNENIAKFEMVFKENIKVSQIHNFDGINTTKLESATITIAE